MMETKIVREEQGDQPELRHLVDISIGEEHQPSGLPDEATGKILTNNEFIEDFAKKVVGATHVISSSNGLSSEAVKKVNAELARDTALTPAQKRAAFMVTKIAVMPKKGQQ